jgi:RNA polymerase sigma factor (TIGR02999 family)
LLTAAANGSEVAAGELLPLVYAELRRVAEAYLRRERGDHTLQATALVHEAYIRLVDQRAASFTDKAHFMRVAARAMRRILVDHARARKAEKRGGEGGRGSAR